MSKIGLKLANGEFYPVLEEKSAARKRLVVTTVQDGQRSVQIDIYRGNGATVASAEYVGSLVIDSIPFSPKGEPDIRLDLSVDAQGRLVADAEELSSGEHRSLEVSLESLNEEGKYEIPDFAFEEDTDSLPETEDVLDSGAPAYSGAEIVGLQSEDEVDEAPKKKTALIVLFVVLVLALVLGGAYLVYRFALAPKSATVLVEATPAPPPPPVVEAAPPPPPPAAEPAPPPPAAEAAPAPEPPKPEPAKPAGKKPGVNYKLRWGDTLWDLSYTYYQNPWLFGKIAKANKIRNPDYIIAGRTIWIPPR